MEIFILVRFYKYTLRVYASGWDILAGYTLYMMNQPFLAENKKEAWLAAKVVPPQFLNLPTDGATIRNTYSTTINVLHSCKAVNLAYLSSTI